MDSCLSRTREKQALKEDPELLERWDDTYGDRMTELVFIGIDMNQTEIEQSLDTCLLTDEELKRTGLYLKIRFHHL